MSEHPELDEFVAEVLADETPGVYRRMARAIDQHLIATVLEYYDGNKSQAAKRLGISRMQLNSMLRQIRSQKR